MARSERFAGTGRHARGAGILRADPRTEPASGAAEQSAAKPCAPPTRGQILPDWIVYVSLPESAIQRLAARDVLGGHRARRRAHGHGAADRLSGRRPARRLDAYPLGGGRAARARRDRWRRAACRSPKSTKSGARSRPPPATLAQRERERDKAIEDLRRLSGSLEKMVSDRTHELVDEMAQARAGRGDAAPGAEDGGDRPADRRHRARLQQHAGGRARQSRSRQAAPRQGRDEHRAVSHRRAGRRQPRRRADPAAARLLAPAAARARAGRRQQAGLRHVRDAAPDARRGDPHRDRAGGRAVAHPRRSQPAGKRACSISPSTRATPCRMAAS